MANVKLPATRTREELLRDDLDAVWLPADAAAFLGLTESTLAARRRTGDGPRYIKLGTNRVGYRKRNMLEFIETHERQSTSDQSTPGPTEPAEEAVRPGAGLASGAVERS
jgi:predicted DNA-binding transcriptional regulator AlpA